MKVKKKSNDEISSFLLLIEQLKINFKLSALIFFLNRFPCPISEQFVV